MINKHLNYQKIIADTCIWIEFLKNNPVFFTPMQDLLEKNNIFAVECIFGELLQGAKSKREIELITAYWNILPKLNEENIWIEAGMYSGEKNFFEKGIGFIDSVLLVLSLKNNLKIWTIDKKLSSLLLPGQIYS
jgi:predicted nucleic acid-binding protein